MVERLYQWHKPAQFWELLKNLSPSDPADYFFKHANQVFRDGFIAGEFASKASVDKVRLERDIWPDFEVRQSGQVTAFEATQADIPGRSIGKEYIGWKREGYCSKFDEMEACRARRDAIPQALDIAINKKLEKNYDRAAGQEVGLVIYLNLGTYGWWRESIESEIRQRTRRASAAFGSVWVLWNGSLYRTWPDPILIFDRQPDFDLNEEDEKTLFDEACNS